jgi:hypothetical protein
MSNVPGFALGGAGLGPGAEISAGPVHGPLWHPSPQCAVVFPQYPYIEQQLPNAQFPHTVLPFDAPHVPSVVACPVAAAESATVVAGLMIGSSEVVAALDDTSVVGFEEVDGDGADDSCWDIGVVTVHPD